MPAEPIFDLAHLAHMEMLTPKPDESLKFFIDVMGMTETARRGDSVYLRGWDDYEHHTLKLTSSKTSGMGHMAFRARSQQALERRVAALKGSDYEIGWTDGDLGHGPAFAFRDPDGHNVEIYYETEWYKAPPELRPALKNQSRSKVVTINMRGIGSRPRPRMLVVASMPSMTGIRTSMRMTSGRVAPASATASAPLDASPSTSNSGSESTNTRKPPRTRA
jgi:catechol 2,3-dioxygenase-like lactoylglutathione lyase family enzyme